MGKAIRVCRDGGSASSGEAEVVADTKDDEERQHDPRRVVQLGTRASHKPSSPLVSEVKPLPTVGMKGLVQMGAWVCVVFIYHHYL